MADTKAVIEKLNDGNYAVWKFKMRLLLTKEKVLKVVTDPKPATADATWTSNDEKAQALIGLALEDTQLVHVMTKKTAKEMWDALKDYHERASLSSIIHVVRQLITIRMSEDGNMAEHLKEMTALRLRLTALGEEVKDNWFVALMLSSLPRSYDGLIVALESRPDADLTEDFVKGKLLDEGRRRVESECHSDNKALVINSAKSKKVFKPKVKKDIVCHYCQKEGHIKRDCRKMIKDRQENVSVAAERKQEIEVCLAAGSAGDTGVWYLDSGATSHMTNDASILGEIDESKGATICLADGKTIKSTGAGSGKISCVSGDGARVKVNLGNVFHVPSLASNLLSVGRIADLGLNVLFEKSGCKVLKGSEVVLVGQRKNGLYHLKQFPDKALLTEAKHSAKCEHLWHRRLGHRDSKAITRIVREKLGSGLQISQCNVTAVCGACCEGKMSRDSFPKASKSRAYEVGELVHTDLGGPMEVQTPRGNRYYIVLVDDYSRYSVLYLLQHKSDAELKIREYCNMMKNQFGRYPKCIRSDGGGEYSGKALKKFFADNGIVQQMSAPYSPQQNGVAERKNRYLKEMMRCMLAESGLEKKFWGEAINTANYLQNRCPSSSIVCTPYEMWNKKKPSYKHLKIFGSEAYVHVPKEKRKALDVKSVKLVLVGYEDGRKAYRFLDVHTGHITISRDAKILELCSVKEAIRAEPVASGGFFDVPLSSSPSEPDRESDLEEDIDADVNSVGSGADSDTTFNGSDSEGETARRSQRSTKGIPPSRLIEEIFTAETAAGEEAEPKGVSEALACDQKNEWKAAMENELKSHSENGTWDLVDLPKGRKPVGCRWVFKLKRNANGQVIKHKARLVAQGFSQKFGEDYDEVFAPVATHSTFRLLLALASKKGMTLKHFDVQTAYLHGQLDEELYMVQPPGHVVQGKENMVCRLRRSIYGLKQSARCWNKRLDAVLKSLGFKQSTADPCLYTKTVNGKTVYLLVYVDDILVGCVDETEIGRVYGQLKKQFDMTDLGDLSYFLGMEVSKDAQGYNVSLKGYIDRVCDKFGLRDAKGAKTAMETGYVKGEDKSSALSDTKKYRSLVGALLYVAVCARPDVAVSASILGRKVSAPTEADWVAAKRVVRYLKATKDWRLQYSNSGGELVGFSDADWAGDIHSRKSTTGFVYLYAGGAVSWCSRKQTSVTLSSMESEYVALSEASQELQWLLKLLQDLGEPVEGPVTMLEDNQSCITFASSERSTRRSKHIETRENYVRELCQDGVLKLRYCPTEDMVADILTKPLGTVKQKKFSDMMGLSRAGGNKR